MPLNLSDLKPSEGSNTRKKRIGRGIGSGKGKTSGKGHKGQNSRSGPGVRIGFEGGQLPIMKRMPYKRGFTNIFATPWEIVNISSIEERDLSGTVTPEILAAHGLIRGTEYPVKILANGDFSRSVTVEAHAFSGAARERIEKAGGSVVVLERDDRWVEARPRSRKMAINRDLKTARLGKVGGIESKRDPVTS